MTPPHDNVHSHADPGEDLFAELLAEWDESQGAGVDAPARAACDTPLEGEFSERLRKAQACLKLLKQFWPPARAADEDGSPAGRAYARFGRYEILRELGRGGHGVVFLAADPTLKRQVALKVPRPEVLSSEELSRRFLREAEAAARLDHPNILPVFEVGMDGPICFTAAAYCDGGTLQEWLAQGHSPVEPREAAGIILELATAIHHAHTRGVLHRDLKPSNVLLVSRQDAQRNSVQNEECRHDPSASLCGSAGEPAGSGLLRHWVLKISDFGLAKVADEHLDSTANGIVMGTVNYMAPEQAAGRPGDVGITTDVYSLGVMLYELLTGAPPFLAASQLATLQRVERDEAAWPSVTRRRVPADLRTICLTCLEKDPGQRYPSAAALAGDLSRFLRGEPVTARPLSVAERTRRALQRHPALAVLSAMAICLVIGFVAELVLHNRTLAKVNEGLAGSIEREKQQTELAHRLRLVAEEHADENQRRSLAADLRLAQHFADAGSLRQFTRAIHGTITASGGDDLHEFAWRYWWHRCRRAEYFVLPGHGKHVSDAEFSADGRWIATGSSDFSVRIWNGETGLEQARLYGGQHEIEQVAGSPDGKLLAAGDRQGGLRVWSAEGWQLRHILRPHAGAVRGLAFRDSQTLLSVGEDAELRVWDLSEGAVVDQHEFSNGRRVTALAVSRQSDLIILGFASGEIQVRALGDVGTLLHKLPGHRSEICGLSVSLQGDRALSCDLKGNYRLWNLSEGETIRQSPENCYSHSRTAFSPNGDRLALVTADAKVQVLDADSGTVLFERQLEIESVGGLDFSPDGRAVLVSGSEGQVALWQPFDRRPEQPQGHHDEAWCVAFAEDSRTFVTGSDDETLLEWETATGKLLRTIVEKQPGTVASAAYSPDNRLLVTTSLEDLDLLKDNVRLWKMPEGKLLGGLEGHSHRVYSAAFHPSGRYFATGSLEVLIWDAQSKQRFGALNDSLQFGKKVKSIAFSKDGSLLAFASENNHAYVYDFPQLQRRHALASGSEVWCVAFSPDGKKLAAGNSDGEVAIWDPQTGKKQLTLKGHLDGVRCVAFTHDGRTIATGSDDDTIKLWEPVTGQEFSTLSGHSADIYALAFSPDDQWLVSCSFDGAVKLWPAPHIPVLGLPAVPQKPKE